MIANELLARGPPRRDETSHQRRPCETPGVTGRALADSRTTPRRGLLASRSGDEQKAEKLLLQSLASAEEAGATGWSLRSALSLAYLRRDAGRESEAAAVLGPIVARIVDGTGTKDFDDAQKLLLQLSPRRTNKVRFG